MALCPLKLIFTWSPHGLFREPEGTATYGIDASPETAANYACPVHASALRDARAAARPSHAHARRRRPSDATRGGAARRTGTLPAQRTHCHPPRCRVTCAEPRAHAIDARAIVCASSATGRTPPPTTSMARRGARSLRRCISSRSYGSSSGPSCRRAAVPSATPRTLRSAATYSRARTGAHSPSRAPPRVRVARCLCALIMPDVSLVLVQVVRRVLPEAAQDGGAGRRAQGAVLPVVPPRVPKDHGVARHAAAGRRVAGGALDARKPGPAAMRGLYAMALRYATPGGAEARRGGRGCASAVRAHI